MFQNSLEKKISHDERELIVDVLSLDPRPSQQRPKINDDEQVYKLWLGRWDISWQLNKQEIQIIDLQERP
ncbi:MAG: hypothetical protein HYV97_08130 [Bdellovibrio sp.]|nr:hypothetical protein [Bdellovibrio sp.]